MAGSLSEDRSRWISRYVIPHEKWLRNKLNSCFSRRTDIDDIIQETYLRLMKASVAAEIHSPRAYALRTARSVVLQLIRRERMAAVELPGSVSQYPSDAVAADEQIAARDELVRVDAALSKLGSRPREIFTLRRINGIPIRDVASRLGISESTVEKNLRKIEKNLRTCCEW